METQIIDPGLMASLISYQNSLERAKAEVFHWTKIRDDHIVHLHGNGYATAEIARKIKLTDARIRQIIKEHKAFEELIGE